MKRYLLVWAVLGVAAFAQVGLSQDNFPGENRREFTLPQLNRSYYPGRIDYKGDMDWYQFTIPAPGGLARIYTTGPEVGTAAYLEASSGQALAWADGDEGGQNIHIDINLPPDVYYLRIWASPNLWQSGSYYGITINFEPTVASASKPVRKHCVPCDFDGDGKSDLAVWGVAPGA